VIDFARIAEVATRVGAPMMVDMAHNRGPRRRRRPSKSGSACRFRDDDTHKTLRGPRAGMVLCREKYAKDLDRTVFPGVQGGP
jgi:glycine hydroxymethyltransferase